MKKLIASQQKLSIRKETVAVFKSNNNTNGNVRNADTSILSSAICTKVEI